MNTTLEDIRFRIEAARLHDRPVGDAQWLLAITTAYREWKDTADAAWVYAIDRALADT